MKSEKQKVTRILQIAGQEDKEVGTTVNRQIAETFKDIEDLVKGDKDAAVEYFNAGRWAELRIKVSNALAGKSAEQKAVDRMISAMKLLNSALTDEQARNLILQMPNMEAATKVSTEPLPLEINEDYFDEKKAARVAAKTESAAGPKN